MGAQISIISQNHSPADIGQSRFLRVQKNGQQLIKSIVLVPSMTANEKIDDLQQLRRMTAHMPTFIVYDELRQNIINNELHVSLIRPYIGMSLYDRIATRPFLTKYDKLWISYQLVAVMSQLESAGLVHGDLKTENIVVTSYNQVYVVDAAPFKPKSLPIDDPADFLMYFDSSQRRSCYLAPERFRGQFGVECDAFSLGCVLAELYRDGDAMFTFSQMLQYIKGASLSVEFDELPIAKLLDRDPKQRLRVSEVQGFPSYFEWFYRYLVVDLFVDSVEACDYRVSRLYEDFSVVCQQTQMTGEQAFQQSALILPLLSSSLRNLRSVELKVQCLELISVIGKKCSQFDLIDIIVPLLVHTMSNDTQAIVKSLAIKTLGQMVSMLSKVPQSDVDLMPDFVLPGLKYTLQDKSVIVRSQAAQSMHQFVCAAYEILAVNYQPELPVDVDAETSVVAVTYDEKLQDLTYQLEELLVILLMDNSVHVKMSLILTEFGKLCKCVGVATTSNVILSHMISYLNDQDPQLRAAFFESVGQGVGQLLGATAVKQYIIPLIQQSAQDQDESVVAAVLGCLSQLAPVIKRTIALELLTQVAPLLIHPSGQLKSQCLKVVQSLAQVHRQIDMAVFFGPILSPYLVYTPNTYVELKHALVPAVSRQLLEVGQRTCSEILVKRGIGASRVTSQDVHKFTAVLQDRHKLQQKDIDKLISLLSYLNQTTVARKVSTTQEIIKVNQTQLDVITHTVFITPQQVPPQQPIQKIEVEVPQQAPSITEQTVKTLSSMALLSKHRSTPSTSVSPTVVNAQFLEPVVVTSRPSSAMSNVQKGSQQVVQTIDYLAKVVQKKAAQQFPEQIVDVGPPRQPVPLTRQKSGKPVQWRPQGVLIGTLAEHSQRVNQIALSYDQRVFATASYDGTVKVWNVDQFVNDVTNYSKATYSISDGQAKNVYFCNGSESVVVASGSSVELVNVDYMSEGYPKRGVTKLFGRDFTGIIQVIPTDKHNTQFGISTDDSRVHSYDLRSNRVAWKIQSPMYQGFVSAMTVDSLNSSWLTTGTSEGVITCWDTRFLLPIKSWLHPAKSQIHKLQCYQSLTAQRCKRVFCAAGVNELALWDLEKGEYREVFSAKHIEDKPSRFVKTLRALQVPSRSQFLSARSQLQVPSNQDPSFRAFWYKSECNYILTGGVDSKIRYWNLAHIDQSFIVTSDEQDSLQRHFNSHKVDGVIFHHEQVYKSAMKKPSQIPRLSSATLLSKKSQANVFQHGHYLPQQFSSYYEAAYTNHTATITDIAVTDYPQPLLLSADSSGLVKIWK